MNRGFDPANGEAIGSVDSDDVIGRNLFTELWKVYTARDYEIVKWILKERETEEKCNQSELDVWIKQDIVNFLWDCQAAVYKS